MPRYKAAEKLIGIERKIQTYWKENKVPERVISKPGNKKFYFLDGPPYVTERSHIGTAWNKVLKDTILRYKRMQGYWVWPVPGYDTHGLPIEVMVEKKLGIRNKKEIINIGIDKFNRECLKLAKRNIDILTEQFRNLGVWMDWQNPYATFSKDYISNVWWVIKKGYEKDLLEEDLRVFHWCPRCETVLSEHEVSLGYKDVEGPSIYVKFPLNDSQAYLLVWTTTPWTLPSNVAVAAHPDLIYVRIKLINSGEEMILLESRLNEVVEEDYDIIERFDGYQLEGKRYTNPLIKYVEAQKEVDAHFVVLSTEYVSPDEGTGLVHIAPEHGKEDFDIGKEYNLPIITIVDNQGRFVEKAGKYFGKYVFDADKEIIEDLKEMGVLYKRESVIHRYPHCWRCKTPLVMKTTKQWILKLSTLRDKLLEENDKIKWIPDWAGSQRFRSWLETARDWVITRQRYWGTPVPIWRCNRCNSIRVIGGYEELEAMGFRLENLHKPFIDEIKWKCDKCDGTMIRIPDVLDVWIDSGAASWASLGYPKNKEMFETLWPVDFITEGHDQTRGWFYSLLCLGIIGFEGSPYDTVLVHGFTLDEKGIGMSKSLGNVIYPEEVTDVYGIDAFRVFVLDHTIWEDMIVNTEKTKEAVRNLNIILNVYDFYSTYASIDNYKWSGKLDYSRLMEEDKWIVSSLEKLVSLVTEMMDNYHVHSALRQLIYFIVEEVSRKYIKLVRRRVWIEEDNPEKKTVYDTLHYVLKKIVALLAPFTPYLSEYLYLEKISKFEEDSYESIHLHPWPDSNNELIDEKLMDKYQLMWTLIALSNSIRQSKKIKIRQPLDALHIPKHIHDKLTLRNRKLLCEQANVHKLIAYQKGDENNYIKCIAKPKKSVLGNIFKEDLDKVVKVISNLNDAEVKRLLNKGEIEITYDAKKAVIKSEYLEISVVGRNSYAVSFYGDNVVALDTAITKTLLYEGLAKEIVRRIQFMRKEMNLDILDNIDIYVDAGYDDILNTLKEMNDYILYETRGVHIYLNEPPEGCYKKTWDIEGKKITIGIRKR